MCIHDRSRPLVVLIAFLFAATCVTAEVATFGPVKDNTLFDYVDGARSSGAGNLLFVGVTGNNGGNRVRRALLAFDVAGSIPAGATIESAELRLSLFNVAPGSGMRVVTVHKMLADWGEGGSSSTGGSGASAQPAMLLT